MTQAQKILRDLKKGERITPLDAMKNYGCMRLAARIYDLRAEHNIEQSPKTVDSGATVAEYRIDG